MSDAGQRVGEIHRLVAYWNRPSLSSEKLTDSMNNSLFMRLACTNLCSVTKLCFDESKLRWMCFSVRSVCPQVMLLSWLGIRLEDRRSKVEGLHGQQSVFRPVWFLAAGCFLRFTWVATGWRRQAGRHLCSFGSLLKELVKLWKQRTKSRWIWEVRWWKHSWNKAESLLKETPLPSLVTPSSPSSPFY